MEQTALSILKQYWGYDKFRPLQEEIIHDVLLGKDTLALLPTGGGKSICFQVPALLKEGICIVITPLIALMKDQVENLRKRNIPAIAIFSGMSPREVDIALDNCIFGQIKFLYLSPERLYSDLVQERIRHMKVNLFAIDEAHCISQWGYDFRPPYLELVKLRDLQAQTTFLALTATATPLVVEDIQEKLGFKEQHVLSKSFKRDNLGYMIFEEEDKMGRMMRIVQKMGGTGIIYVRNRRETQEVAQYLFNHGVSADYYHAGLDLAIRMKKQEAWTAGKTRIIVATNAFGMGIDKADVRFVIHLDIPDSLEAYYQEAGRAGRDGKKAYPVLLYNQSDRDGLWENIELNFPEISFIQQVYHQLCNYFQIAFGAGKNMTFDFDVLDFSKRYKLEVLKTLAALKFLEGDGWITLTEAVYIPARFKFEVDYQELYKLQVQSAIYDPIIKAILRFYGGVFDFFVPINEFEIAKKLGKSYDEIVQILQKLQQLELATYIAKKDSPQLQFLASRVDYKHLHIDAQFIASRRQLKQEQVKAIYGYLDQKTCRSIALQRYFGEETDEPCAACDLCLVRVHQTNQAKVIEEQFKNLLIERPLSLHNLIESATVGKESLRLKVLRTLIDQEKILVDNDLYSWKAF
ncbi:RecQ family ATP-dependent DNA helicase [Sphingobacterium sp. HJSM2_6]|uniref:RecQ family ATP-dependent DNA helicase n=1 Tax=Sphingobacterium sp. HJSM2_6 TaxID=3366264 RepID=UPI003BE1F5E5